MNYRLKTLQFIVFSAIIALAALAVYMFILLDIRDKNRSVSLILNEADIEALQDLRLRSIQKIVKDTEEQRGQINIYFVGDDEIVKFIETVELLGVLADADVEINSVNIEERRREEGEENDEFLQLTFSATGEWNEVFYFFSLVELLPYNIEVKRASFESGSKEKSGIWNGSFGITVAKSKSN